MLELALLGLKHSRGAKSVTFVDASKNAYFVIQKILHTQASYQSQKLLSQK